MQTIRTQTKYIPTSKYITSRSEINNDCALDKPRSYKCAYLNALPRTSLLIRRKTFYIKTYSIFTLCTEISATSETVVST